jgi:tetratricopeptide (TPR) repeat protein
MGVPTFGKDRLRLWQGAQTIDPAKAPVLTVVLAARMLREAAMPREAERLLRLAWAAHPSEAALGHTLGQSLESHQPVNWPEVVECFRAARALRPELGHELAEALRAAGRGQEARAVYEDQVRRDPDHPWWHNNLGNVLRDVGDVRGAVAEYRKAADLDPKWSSPHYNIGQVLRISGDVPGAVAAYRQALDLDPKDAKPHFSLAIMLHTNNDLARAAVEYRKAIDLDPKDAQSHDNLGDVLRLQGDLPGSAAEHRRAIALDPASAGAHNNLGITLVSGNDLPGAVKEFRQAVALDPNLATAHTNLGVALRIRRDLPGATAELRRAIALNPKDPNAHLVLGLALLQQGSLVEAGNACRRALQLLPPKDSRRQTATEALQISERLLGLDRKLSALLAGERTLADPREMLELARLCQQADKARHATAARLYAEALAADPRLADDPGAGVRYDAACNAALAAAGKGRDATILDAQERARLRQQALDWLRADLAAWAKLLADNPQKRSVVREIVGHWKQDADPASVRDPEAVASLPAAERDAWRKLWADVDDLLAQTADKK